MNNVSPVLIIIAIVGLLFILVVVKRFLPKGKAKALYVLRMQDLAAAKSTRDNDKKSALFFQLYITTDSLLRVTLEENGLKADSVMKQIRSARFDKNLIDYNEYITLKAFHLKRNKLVHEGDKISISDQKTLENTLLIISKLV